MDSNLERKGLKHLEHIEKDLDAIKQQAPSARTSFINGLWQGAGVILGSIIAFGLIGYLLSIFGVLPGFASIAHYLQGVVDNTQRRL